MASSWSKRRNNFQGIYNNGAVLSIKCFLRAESEICAQHHTFCPANISDVPEQRGRVIDIEGLVYDSWGKTYFQKNYYI
jgi:hypothetical protein